MEKNKNNNEGIFIKKYQLIFRKYHPLKKIANGAFSEIFYGVNVHTKEKVAIKIESRYVVNKLLESECFLLFSLKGVGIPKVLSFGHNKEYDILIMPLLGKSLKELYISKNCNFEFKDVCLIAIQIIERIKWVHSKKIIHRDIKPDNFLIGLNDPNIIYLIDFGLSKKYQSSTTGKHIKFTEVKKFTGTVLYASVNALRFKEQSRRDDLESIGYMLIHLMKGSLPWQKIKVNNKKESYMKISEIKKHINTEKLCENLPGEMIDYINYVRKLQFEESPDYNYLGNLFQIMLKKRRYDPDNVYFSWIDENIMKRLKKPVNYSKRSSCSRERIINKIKKSLDVKKSLSANKNIWKQNTDYNMKIKRYIDENVLNNMKHCELSKMYAGTRNEKHPIDYINNAINNNYITISVSISNNTHDNLTFLKNENKNILLNSVSNMKKLNNNIIPLSQKPSDTNIIKNNEYSQNIKNIEKCSTYFKKYHQNSPNILMNKENTDNIPFIDSGINTNQNLAFNNKKFKNRNKNDNNISSNQVMYCNSYNKKFSSVNNLQNDKTLYKSNKNYYYNTTNNSNGNLNEKKRYEISYNTNLNNTKNSIVNNYLNYNRINNNIIYNNYNYNYNKQINLNNNIININSKINNQNNNNNIKTMNKNIYNCYNLSYNNLKDMKNKNVKSPKESNKNEHKLKNLYHKNLKIKLFNISPFKKISSNNIQKKNSQSVTNNNELKKELKSFNLKYNYEYSTRYGEEKLKQNKTKRLIKKKLSQVNQSADHNKMLNIKNKMNRVKHQNNTENNCFIF